MAKLFALILIPLLPASGHLPQLRRYRHRGPSRQGYHLFLAGAPANPASITLKNVHRALFIKRGILDSAKLAQLLTITAPDALGGIYLRHIFGLEHHLHQIGAHLDTVSQAIAITVAKAAYVRRLKCPYGMDQTFLVKFTDEFFSLLGSQNLKAVFQIWIIPQNSLGIDAKSQAVTGIDIAFGHSAA
jgi:hypothetical protein